MKKVHEPKRVREPVQVYLAAPDRKRLDRLAEELRLTKSDVLRRALAALEEQLTDPEAHPALRIIGIAGPGIDPGRPDYDVAVEHDRFLAERESGSWPRKEK